jgi:hypothetical protein
VIAASVAHGEAGLRPHAFGAKAGGARRNRTDDLMLAKHALYQLSYGPAFANASALQAHY